MASRGALMLSAKDNVATVLEDVEAGADVPVRLGKEVRNVKALERIPFGFKIAIVDIVKGTEVMKYGESIGIASLDINKGKMVHIHNLEGARGRGDMTKGGSK